MIRDVTQVVLRDLPRDLIRNVCPAARIRPRGGFPILVWLAIWLAICLAAAPAIAAGVEVRGEVRDHRGRPVARAAVAVDGAERAAVSDADGAFTVVVEAGTHVLRVEHPAYATLRREVTVGDGPATIELRLSPRIALSETIDVSAIRAGDQAPVTTAHLEAAEIEARSYGQDAPFLLAQTPSVTAYSDSGIGSNYSYFSLRGIHQTRINMTLDGAPLNDPAENALYFNNFGGFLGFVDSIEIQRGVGTSSVGSPSYGGSVHFSSVALSERPETDVRLGFGSYGTRRAAVGHQTGLLGNGLALYARAALHETDGYRERSGVKQRTLFLSAAHQGERSQLRLTAFSGRERTRLSFLAVDPATLEQNPRFNPLDEAERDRFGQDFAQLRYTRELADESTLTASLYYNGAQGWFRLWDDPVARNDLLEFSLDGHFVGSLVSLSRRGERLSTTWGLHANDFRRDHFLDAGGVRQYRNTGKKREANAFVKVGYDLGHWHLFGDAQVRRADFRYLGDLDLGAIDWTFFDPKLGVRYRLSDRASVYASIGRASREPTRMDLLAGEDNATVRHDLEAVKPERVVDFEAGYDFAGKRLTLLVDLYAMQFRNEIAATGELSDIGLPLRTNVGRSYRRGLEIDLRWAATRRWTITHSAGLSRNRIREWTQFYDVYDEAGSFLGSEPRLHRDVPPLLTPEIVLNSGIRYGRGAWHLALDGRYVGPSHLDNTGSRALRAPSYVQLDARGALRLDRLAGRPRLGLQVNNLFDRDDLYPGGYSYPFLTRDGERRDTFDGIPFYYPLADRNFVVTLDFKP